MEDGCVQPWLQPISGRLRRPKLAAFCRTEVYPNHALGHRAAETARHLIRLGFSHQLPEGKTMLAYCGLLQHFCVYRIGDTAQSGDCPFTRKMAIYWTAWGIVISHFAQMLFVENHAASNRRLGGTPPIAVLGHSALCLYLIALILAGKTLYPKWAVLSPQRPSYCNRPVNPSSRLPGIL